MAEKVLWEKQGTGPLYAEGTSRELGTIDSFLQWCAHHSAGKCCPGLAQAAKAEVIPWRRNSKTKIFCPNCRVTMVAEKDIVAQAVKRIPRNK